MSEKPPPPPSIFSLISPKNHSERDTKKNTDLDPPKPLGGYEGESALEALNYGDVLFFNYTNNDEVQFDGVINEVGYFIILRFIFIFF